MRRSDHCPDTALQAWAGVPAQARVLGWALGYIVKVLADTRWQVALVGDTVFQ